MLRSCEKSISRKKPVLYVEKFPSLVLPRNTTTITAPYYPISCLLSVSVRLQEVKNKRKFQTFSSLKVVAVAYESWSLTKVPSVMIWPKNVWYFGKLVAEERGGRLREMVETGGSTLSSSPCRFVADYFFHFLSFYF